MRQNKSFVPARLVLATAAIIFAAVLGAKASTPVIYASNDSAKTLIDHIVTGQTISSDQLEEWKSKRDKFRRCGLCGEEQAYPGDLPE